MYMYGVISVPALRRLSLHNLLDSVAEYFDLKISIYNNEDI